MGDRTLARISIPAHHLQDAQHRLLVAEVFGVPVDAVNEALAGTPDADEARYENGVSFKMVENAPCLGWEHDEANYGGARQEEALVRAGIPYVLVHGDGGEYSGGAAAFDGKRRCEVELNRQEEIVVQIEVSGSKVRVRPGHLAKVRSYLAIKRAVLNRQRRRQRT